MKTLNCFLLLLLLGGNPLAIQAQTTGKEGGGFQDLIYRAYTANRMPLWETTLQTMEFQYKQRPTDELLYDIMLAQYGLIGYYLGTDQKDEGRALLQHAEYYLDLLRIAEGYEAQAKLFQAAFYAFRINLRPLRSVQLGIPASRMIDEALELNPSYPRGHIEKGNMLFFAPPVFGGSKEKSIGHYERAVELLEADMPDNMRWLYLGTLVSLAGAYEKTGDLPKAIEILEKALIFEPDFRWVKEEMLPDFISRQ